MKHTEWRRHRGGAEPKALSEDKDYWLEVRYRCGTLSRVKSTEVDWEILKTGPGANGDVMSWRFLTVYEDPQLDHFMVILESLSQATGYHVGSCGCCNAVWVEKHNSGSKYRIDCVNEEGLTVDKLVVVNGLDWESDDDNEFE